MKITIHANTPQELLLIIANECMRQSQLEIDRANTQTRVIDIKLTYARADALSNFHDFLSSITIIPRE